MRLASPKKVFDFYVYSQLILHLPEIEIHNASIGIICIIPFNIQQSSKISTLSIQRAYRACNEIILKQRSMEIQKKQNRRNCLRVARFPLSQELCVYCFAKCPTKLSKKMLNYNTYHNSKDYNLFCFFTFILLS